MESVESVVADPIVTAAAATAATVVVGNINWYFLIPLTILLFNIVNMVFGGLVVQARKKYGIPYPTMYAVPGSPRYYDESMRAAASASAEGEADKFSETISAEEAFAFNSIQRGHQNTIENAPFFFAILVAASSKYPLYAGIAGLLYIVGRALYMYGYSQEPKLRIYGAGLIYPSLLTLFVLTGIRISDLFYQ